MYAFSYIVTQNEDKAYTGGKVTSLFLKFKNHITMLKQFVVISLLVFMTSCAKIFFSPDAHTLAKKHSVIAIIPPSISIAASRKVDAEAIKEQQKTESINFQKEIYSWLLKRKMQGKIDQEIQDVQTTNAKLKKAGFPDIPMTPAEISEILGVDGIVSSNFGLSKPMSDGAAIAVGLLVGAWGATNEVRVTLSINDKSKNKLIWNYEHKLSGGVGSSPSRIVDQLMRKASRKMPYVIKD
jgi:hypothetical protein